MFGEVALPRHVLLGELKEDLRRRLVRRGGPEERAAAGQRLERVLGVVQEGHQAEEALEEVRVQL